MNQQTIDDVDLLYPRRLFTRTFPISYGNPFYEMGILLLEMWVSEADGVQRSLVWVVSSFNHVNHAREGCATFEWTWTEMSIIVSSSELGKRLVSHRNLPCLRKLMITHQKSATFSQKDILLNHKFALIESHHVTGEHFGCVITTWSLCFYYSLSWNLSDKGDGFSC